MVMAISLIPTIRSVYVKHHTSTSLIQQYIWGTTLKKSKPGHTVVSYIVYHACKYLTWSTLEYSLQSIDVWTPLFVTLEWQNEPVIQRTFIDAIRKLHSNQHEKWTNQQFSPSITEDHRSGLNLNLYFSSRLFDWSENRWEHCIESFSKCT